MDKSIAVLPGDGIGPEVVTQGVKVLDAIAKKYSHSFHTKEYLMGAAAMNEGLDPLPDETYQGCLDANVILVGAVGDPKYDNLKVTKRPEQGLLSLRSKLQLHTNVRPIKSYKKLHSLSPLKEELVQNVDLIIFRELTGGLYFGKKRKDELGKWAFDECFYHIDEITRTSRFAFDEAMQRRKKLTLVDKANMLETGRLWRNTVTKIHQEEFPEVELDYLYIDNAAMQLIINPKHFDVLLTSNMFGDILSDEASVIVGSIGLLPSGSYGEGDKALFEPVHGSYPQAAGRNIANPLASILSVAMMMEHFELHTEERHILDAVEFAIQEGIGTMDMVPKQIISCSVLGDFIATLILEPKAKWMDLRKNINS